LDDGIGRVEISPVYRKEFDRELILLPARVFGFCWMIKDVVV